MFQIQLTRHALVRQNQRGFQAGDFEEIYRLGTMIGDQEIIMTNKDIEAAISELKYEIRRLQRLRNKKLIVAGESVVSAYSMNSRELRKMRIQRSEH